MGYGGFGKGDDDLWWIIIIVVVIFLFIPGGFGHKKC